MRFAHRIRCIQDSCLICAFPVLRAVKVGEIRITRFDPLSRFINSLISSLELIDAYNSITFTKS